MIKNHFDQNKINEYDLDEIIEHGEFLFKVSFNELDGLGDLRHQVLLRLGLEESLLKISIGYLVLMQMHV